MIYQENKDGHLKPVLIDFGKACKIEQAEFRSIPKKQRVAYREKHSHIAPEIVKGIAKQPTASDIFSLGRIAYYIGQHIHLKEVIDLSISCMNENASIRCSLLLVIEECEIMLSRDRPANKSNINIL